MNDAVAHCLKITEKVSFNIALDAKNCQFGEFLKNWRCQSNSVTRQENFKLVKNAKIKTLKYDICDDFQTLCSVQLGKLATLGMMPMAYLQTSRLFDTLEDIKISILDEPKKFSTNVTQQDFQIVSSIRNSKRVWLTKKVP